MNPLVAFARRLLAASNSPRERLRMALYRMYDEKSDSLLLVRQLVGALRPLNRQELEDGLPAKLFVSMLDELESNERLLMALRHQLGRFVRERNLVTFFTDCGILPGTGFFSECWRIVGNRLLPEVPDERELRDCLHLIFDRQRDWLWLETLPGDQVDRFWALMDGGIQQASQSAMTAQILDSILLLSHRVSGLCIEGELMRASPNLEADRPRFIALSAEAFEFVSRWRQSLQRTEFVPDDGSHLLVISAQCRETLGRIRRWALQVGVSQSLSYLLARSEQSLVRLEKLIATLSAQRCLVPVPAQETAANLTELPSADNAAMVASPVDDHRPESRGVVKESIWGGLIHSSLIAESRRNSLSSYLKELLYVLSRRVTENSARSGEHYICGSVAEYKHMWLSAAGGGVIIAFMALTKIFAAGLHAPLFVEAFMFSMIYGLGFVLIYLLGMTVATKQPAMTAQTLASLLEDIKPNRQADLERLADVISAVVRSQLAAILGNVLVAMPLAIFISLAFGYWFDGRLVGVEKAQHLLADVNPLSWALPHAAIAGVYLFLSGLITGFFDNKAVYAHVGARVARLRWLWIMVGTRRAVRVGTYVQDRLGGIMGNMLFGCMLGATGVVGQIVGLPIDIRHIAFASANLGYAVTALDFGIAFQAFAIAASGVALIGLVNLTVSFALALRTALAARRIRFSHWGPLLAVLGRRLRSRPTEFFVPSPPQRQ
ncbi:MAG: hypothetical protein ACRCTU_01245 [Zoogloea sp.]|uniref:hypothetical protein n=1 Tax=Zoogloea sp. TaxID=49181 RepID=UPI003F3AAE05